LAQEKRPLTGYDRANEVAVRGTVVEVRDMARVGTPHGTYLVLKTPTGTLNVHLGPRAWSAKGRASLSPGEPVEVVGALARYGQSAILLAREVHKANTTLTFRNAQGFPVVGRRQQP
jgi:hypothetical protein